jgi:iron complex outermembrane receptor protein
LVVTLLCFATSLLAEDVNNREIISFNIPQQRADLALTLFAEQANLTLIVPFDEVRDRTANRLVGEYPIEEAIDVLLHDTGLKPTFKQQLVLSIATDEASGPEGENMNVKKTGLATFLASLFVTSGAVAQTLEEIIVTAQKREESAQDIGIAISVLDSARLISSDVNNIQDVQHLVPSLQVGESFGFAQLMIRGIGTDNPFAGGDPSVAMHVDGVVTGQSSAQFGSLFDLDRIEVLRGPQGTLYGRNTTGGSVNVITQTD